jgi:glutamyl-Q tRNA(Asp) synthetase
VAQYRGRFAPSPTGLLHAGSMVAALASWLDARAHQGHWLVRIEDVDTPRCVPGADQAILRQLADCGLHPDEPPTWQSQRGDVYEQALTQLIQTQMAYPCRCSRKDIEAMWAQRGMTKSRHQALVYPGTCRDLSSAAPDACPSPAATTRSPAWRLCVPAHALITWQDRRLGTARQQVDAEVGDFVLKRADGLWSYQLAVVCDDARQGITHVVRGEDLADNTPRQIVLQQALSFATPRYLHTPLVRDARGEKLSKQQGAQPVNTQQDPLAVLNAAAQVLSLPAQTTSVAEALLSWVAAWQVRWVDPGEGPLYNHVQDDSACHDHHADDDSLRLTRDRR